MNMNKSAGAKRLFLYIGEIDDSFLEEGELADLVSGIVTRKRLVKYSTLAAAASVGIAVTYWLLRSKAA
jgi:hypothetical protein